VSAKALSAEVVTERQVGGLRSGCLRQATRIELILSHIERQTRKQETLVICVANTDLYPLSPLKHAQLAAR
jgi:hypothetical protein